MKPSKKQKPLKIVIALFLIFLVIIFFAFDIILSGILKSELKSQFNQNQESYYEINFKSIRHKLFTRSLSIEEISIMPRQIAFDSLEAGKLNTVVSTKINSIHIEEFKILHFFKEKIININSINFKDIETTYLSNPKKVIPENDKSMMMHYIFSDQFKGVEINTLEITNASFTFSNHNTPDKPSFTLDSVGLIINDIVINPSTLSQPIPVSLSNIELFSKNIGLDEMGNYSLSSSGINISLIDSTIAINNFSLKPKYPNEEFSKRLEYENDVFSFSSEKIEFKGFDIAQIKNDNLIALNSIHISNPQIEIYRDKRVKDKPYKYKPLIAKLIKSIPINLDIDTITFNNARLEYLEVAENGKQPGSVFFNPLNISIHKLTNIPEKLAIQPILRAELKGKLMGEGNISIDLEIDMESENGNFSVDGEIGKMKAMDFNPATENLLKIKIVSGEIYGLDFHFDADDNSSSGKINFIYDNLVIKAMKGNKGRSWSTLSFLANSIIRSKNLRYQPKYLEGIIYFERNKNKALPNYIWKSLQSGLVSIISPVAANKTQKKIRKNRSKRKRS